MKSFNLPWKIPFVFLLMLIILVCKPSANQAQTVKRQCISGYGPESTTENIVLLQTAGQPFYTMSSAESSHGVLQGFQQPVVTITDVFKTNGGYSIAVFPNPATNSVIVFSDCQINKSLIMVTDIDGRKMLEAMPAQLNNYQINSENWENGMYIISIYDNDQVVYTQKLIIIK